MTPQELRSYCLAKPGAWPDEPWGDVVAKVHDKIFAFVGAGTPLTVGVKCGPSREQADEWLTRYPLEASAMAYIGRYGWNVLQLGGTIGDDEAYEAVDASYDFVIEKLPRKHRPA